MHNLTETVERLIGTPGAREVLSTLAVALRLDADDSYDVGSFLDAADAINRVLERGEVA